MKSKILKNTSMLYLMNIAKMVFPLITLPYLTRVLTTDCYGSVSFVKAVMQYMQLIVDFGFILSGTKGVVMCKSNPEKLNQETGDILLSKIMLSMVAFFILITMTVMMPILKANSLYVFLSFVPVFLTNFLFDYLFRGLEKMEVITIRFVIMKGFAALLTFVFVKNDADILWMPVLDIIGSLVAIILVAHEIKKLNVRFCTSGISEILDKIKDSAVYFFSNMASTAFMAFNTLLIGIYLNTTQVAYWSLCLQLITAVQSMYTPLTDGIYPYMIESKDLRLLNRAAKIFMPIITAGCIFTVFIAKYVLLIVGGIQYVHVAPVLRALVPVLFFSFLSMLLGWPALGAIGKQKETTLTTVICAIIQIAGLFILIFMNKFTLINIALLRGFTEFILFVLRFYYFKKYKGEFVCL